jgi:hypothetical protein
LLRRYAPRNDDVVIASWIPAGAVDPPWMKLFIRYTPSLRAKRSNLGQSRHLRSRLLRRLRLLAMTPFAWAIFLLAKRNNLVSCTIRRWA